MRGGPDGGEHAEEELGEGGVHNGQVGQSLGRREGGEPFQNGGSFWVRGGLGFKEREFL